MSQKNGYLPPINGTQNGANHHVHNHQHHVHKLPSTKSAATSSNLSDNGWTRPDRFSIIIFKNGDEFDAGTKVGVTRIQMPHWISLLDYLTTRLNLIDGSVQRIYTLDGTEVRHFRQFEHNAPYVAAHGKFRRTNYGGQKAKKPPFGVKTSQFDDNNDAGRLGIYSDEGLRHYLQQNEFEPTLGDVWDNSHFDLRSRKFKMQPENGSSQSADGHVGSKYQNGNYADRSVGSRQISRLTHTEDLAATMISRIRSQSVGPTRQHPYDESVMKKSESQQEFENSSPRSRIDRHRQNAGRTPAPPRNYDEVADEYEVMEMSNGGSKNKGRGRSQYSGSKIPVNKRTQSNRGKSTGRNVQREEAIEAENEAELKRAMKAEVEEEVAEEFMEGFAEGMAEEMAASGKGAQPLEIGENHPRWAAELTVAVRELASEVHHLHPPLTTETVRDLKVGKHKKKK